MPFFEDVPRETHVFHEILIPKKGSFWITFGCRNQPWSILGASWKPSEHLGNTLSNFKTILLPSARKTIKKPWKYEDFQKSAFKKTWFFQVYNIAKMSVSPARELNFDFSFLNKSIFFKKCKNAKSSWRPRKSAKIIFFFLSAQDAMCGFGREPFLRDVSGETHVF